MKERILLIDDSPEVLKSLGRHLQRRYDVTTAESGEVGLELIEHEGPFAVVISDYRMPVMDGIEFLRCVRRLAPETVRLVLTGDGGFDFAKKVLNETQAFRLLSKPCPIEVLTGAIDDALEVHHKRIEEIELTEQLELTKESLEDLTHTLEGRISLQMDTMTVLHHFAVRLNGAQDLREIAAMAAEASFEALHGHGVHVQLWDDDVSSATIQADAGPEMSANMHREALATADGQVGELVVDEFGPDGRKLSEEDHQVLTMIAVPTAVAARNEFRRRERDQAQHATIIALARLSERRDNETGKHIERVSLFCNLIADGLRANGFYSDEVTDAFIHDLVRSAPLHDIGKVGIPDSILLKPGKLTPSEWEIMKTHAEIGAETLEDVIRSTTNPGYLSMGRDIAWAHHERWDGTGYPRGLSGESIPLSARILALADIYDALTTARPYKPAWDHQAAIEWISSLSGNHLDPKVVQVFLERALQADNIRSRLADDPSDQRSIVEQALAAVQP